MSTMKVITEAKSITVTHEQYRCICAHLSYEMVKFGDLIMPAQKIVKEVVDGKRFYVDGQEVVIGATVEAQKEIGILFEVYENQSREISSLYRRLGEFQDRVSKAERAGFWKRLKWLFKGVKA